MDSFRPIPSLEDLMYPKPPPVYDTTEVGPIVSNGFDFLHFSEIFFPVINCNTDQSLPPPENHGKVIEIDNTKMAYTRHEPIGVVGAIIPCSLISVPSLFRIDQY
jgi:hypothetical protein